ncbi:MAG TPA: hypothetical protein VGP41_12420 [Candidatus Lustribacter sp.]|nr:hypothetical protein [Candidatus Lustribacter sp.]
MTTPLRVIAALTAAILLPAAGSTSVEQVGRTRAAIVLPDAAPIGSIILIPGGTTLQRIDAAGNGSNSTNFVMHIRPALLAAGFALAYVENPADERAIVARMRAVKRPVFTLSTSNGTAIAASSAAALGADGPDGIVLTSTVTIPSRLNTSPASTVDVGKITVPVLFVHNTDDGCPWAPWSGIAPLMLRFNKNTDVTRIDVTSTRVISGPCDPLAPHGYLGIEDGVAAKIIAWMQAHGAT